MRIAIGCDDIGFPVKTSLIVALESGGHVVLDLGSFSTDPVDYPDYARVVGQAVLRGFAEAGVLRREGARAARGEDPAARGGTARSGEGGRESARPRRALRAGAGRDRAGRGAAEPGSPRDTTRRGRARGNP